MKMTFSDDDDPLLFTMERVVPDDIYIDNGLG